MDPSDPHLSLRLAVTDADRRGAERLRYRVFVEELGGDGALVDHAARLERDRFDPFFDHLILVDDRRDAATCDHVVGVYRLMTDAGAARAGQFYSEDEYDLAPLRASGRRLLELGRSCVHPDHRGGAALFLLWSGLADYVIEREIEILFGVASFHGTDPAALAMPLSYLHHHHLAPPELRVRSRVFQPMDLLPAQDIDRLAALQAIPPLIKAYLRLGGVVGEGAFIDRPFNTTDVCLIMDTAHMNARAREIYARGARSRPRA
ncbi:GNAT family N-acetyltransferase [Palleronia sp. KMU-117]|uniref:GNAT family N-acetyltransferase n=1 Tax=Palleronia sp. KMU-117 TaxID=3434108 RepID=UPI003D732AA6